MTFDGQDVLVLGLGMSGCSAADYLSQRGARVVAADERDPESIPGLASLAVNVERRVGKPFPDPAAFDLVVPSPGVPAARYADRARKAWGDIELCYRALDLPIVAVTGTNGKSTVVRLIETLARGAGLRARAAGNLGLPALELVGEPLDLAILEVSSFQLESVDTFRPRIGLLLNVTPDHLDRHGDLAGYLAAKARLFARQGAGDVAIVNQDDPLCARLTLPAGVERLAFSRRGPVEAGAWLEGRSVIIRRAGRTQQFSLEGLEALEGQLDNLMAALLAIAALELDLDAAAGALVHFEGLPHRCQLAGELGGVRYVDDSKATNVGAAERALQAFDAPIVWIAGGRHKGGDLSSLVRCAEGRVRRALLIGEAAEIFERALADHVSSEISGDLDHAVSSAAAIAQPGDVVLLAPACASFDQFPHFEARGRAFQSAVARLVEAETAEAGGGR